ncbi:MAG: Ig-like domain-containing protein, partial [Candidatus Aenigmarchaeota archaeon]|nr:Ig-like domain-containing protein [Candidatus Aenigmarchaeota archaeon]
MFSFSTAYAVTLSNANLDPESPVWLESSTLQMDFTVDCQNNTEIPKVYLTLPDTTITLITLDSGNAPYIGRYTISQEGNYQANFTCTGNETTTSSIIPFEVKKMTLDITSPENDNVPTVYPTGVIENIRLSLKINGVSVKVEEDPGFTATLVDTSNNRYAIDILEKRYDDNLKEWLLDAQLTNKDIPAALYSIEIIAKYTDSKGQDHTVTDKSYNSVRVNQALIAVMQSPTPGTKLSLSTSKEQEIHIQVHEKGTSLPGLGATSFKVILTGDGITKELPVNALSYDENSNYYMLTVLIPEMDEKEVTYDLYAELSYGNYKKAVTEKVQVDFVLSVSGRLADPTGNVYTSQNTMIKFINNNTEKTLSINGLGDYSESLKAGKYTIRMQFPQVWQVKVDGVNLKSSSRNPIRYDQFTGNPGISGINIAKLVVIEFGLPFDKAYLQIPYNDALVKNENMLEVYACSLWNFGSRECSTTWSKIPVKTDIVANFVEFNVTHLSAFVIGEKMGIFFEGELDATDVYSGEPVTLESRVLDAKGNGVKGAEVSYAISGTSLQGKTTTGDSGEFTLVINTPNTAGKHSINIIAEKVPFS